MVTALGFSQREVRFLALRDVLDDALQPRHVAGRVVQPDPAFPDPTYAALGMLDPIFALEAAPRDERLVDNAPHARAVLGMRQLLVGQPVVEQQIFRWIPRYARAAATHELHRPVRVVAASVDHAVEIAEQSLEHARRV